MAITVDDIAEAVDIEEVIQEYMAGGLDKEQTREMLKELMKLKVSPGDRLLFRYPVPDPNNPAVPPRWYAYAVRCPRCRKPSVYFFQDFGPGCSGMDGGCGYKVPKEKRPWYDPPSDVNRGRAPYKT
ncbi:MAG: hypothetical protein Q7R85_02635 [bacterium]|nr:hypothetical protein [bacterium]